MNQNDKKKVFFIIRTISNQFKGKQKKIWKWEWKNALKQKVGKRNETKKPY